MNNQPAVAIRPLLNLPDPAALLKTIGPEGLSQLKAEADEIVGGRVRLFGGQPVPLELTPPGELSHWTEYALGKSAFPIPLSPNYPTPDIKFVWEPARFGWVFTLGRAYHLTGDACYPMAFWRYFDVFQQANPVNQGPNWESAQEVALRLIALTFAAQIFSDSVHSTTNRKSQISKSIANHAVRILPTLTYARAQNNNHLLSEAAGLITASLALPEHPQAERWSSLGWKWFQYGIKTQIDDYGAYMQQSTNYHRLVLQLALWIHQVSRDTHHISGCLQPVVPDLQLATQWLLALTDVDSGCAPNLGPNDGAYILPLTALPFNDYRPVLQAASQIFLGKQAFKPGLWDEMSFWFTSERPTLADNQPLQEADHQPPSTHHASAFTSPTTLHTHQSWAYLRAAYFHDRPGHADQLHLDLWWRGLNIAQDAGTYLYNADPPWDNPLTHTAVHNTVMVDNSQQMTPAGRFLYLDRAQAEVSEFEQAADGSRSRIVAIHDGYQHLGVIHQRSVTADQNGNWTVQDDLLPTPHTRPFGHHMIRLNWLLPDWQWKMDESETRIEILSPYGWIILQVNANSESPISSLEPAIFRAGVLLSGTAATAPTWGWVSPTYGVKVPAVSFAVIAVSELPLTLTSEWSFPND